MSLKIFLQRHIIYKCAVLITMLLCTVFTLHIALAPYLRIILVWGALEIALDFFTGRRCWKMKDVFILLAFLAVYLISVLLGDAAYLTANLKAVCYMAVVFVSMYGGAYHEDAALLKKELNIVARVMQLALFLITAVCFYSFLIDASYRYTPRDYVGVGYFGMTGDRLAGLFSPNTGGAVYVLLILISAGLIYAGRKKAFSIVSIALGYMCLALSQSRTALVAMAAALLVAVLVFWGGKKLFVRILIGLISVVLIVGLAYPLRKGLALIPENVSFVTEAKAWALDIVDLREDEELEDYNAVYSGALDAFLSGRLTIWRSGLAAYSKNPVTGITNEAIVDKVTEELPDESLTWTLQGGGLHNVYLTVLVAAGIPGVLVLLFFAARKLRGLLAMPPGSLRGNKVLCVLLTIIIFALISELMETRILFSMNFFFAVFWLVLGYASAFARSAGGENIIKMKGKSNDRQNTGR